MVKESIMKYAAMLLLLLAGCATKPEPDDAKLMLDSQVQPMSRNAVILAIKECETSGLRAVMITSKRKVNGFSTDIVIDITCMPKY